ncbi:hypothetical protein LPTSP4_27590 [Leptospira ryugenii]|uniref:Uncharacterized protein n=1 Tax=Leptospira ryugenii TaxID=1917863 RepID=A0A2P2E2Y0_9LEPT|nr:hypothetical protein LPTSP4_27590 [Leptospira ryugenii]
MKRKIIKIISKLSKTMTKLLLLLNIFLLMNCKSQREASCIKDAEGSVLQACLLQRTDGSRATPVFAIEICLVEINDYRKCINKP